MKGGNKVAVEQYWLEEEGFNEAALHEGRKLGDSPMWKR